MGRQQEQKGREEKKQKKYPFNGAHNLPSYFPKLDQTLTNHRGDRSENGHIGLLGGTDEKPLLPTTHVAMQHLPGNPDFISDTRFTSLSKR